MNKEFIIIIVGLLLTITIYGSIIGLPLILIGAYLLNKKTNNPTQEIQKEIHAKQEELDNINTKLSKMEDDKKTELDQLEKEKTEEITNKLKSKQEEIDNINLKLDQMEKEKTEELDEKLKTRKEELANLDEKYEKLTEEKEKQLSDTLSTKESLIENAENKLQALKEEIVEAEDTIEFQEYGLYEPKYNFINSTDYKERLDAVRKQQKQMIKDKTAAIATKEWTVDGDKRKGQAMTNANIKQILRSFNNETEVIINKVKHSNLEASRKRIEKSYDQLNRLYEREHVQLTKGYLNLKLDEMHLAYEYEVKKEDEKEALREAREREREEKKLQGCVRFDTDD